MILYKENFIEDLINHGLFSHFSQDSTFKVSTKYSRKKIYGYTLQVGKKKKTSENRFATGDEMKPRPHTRWQKLSKPEIS